MMEKVNGGKEDLHCRQQKTTQTNKEKTARNSTGKIHSGFPVHMVGAGVIYSA